MWRPKDPVHLSNTAFSDIAGVLSGHARDGNAAGQRRQVRQRNMARTTLEPDWMSGSVRLQRGRGNLRGHPFNNRGR